MPLYDKGGALSGRARPVRPGRPSAADARCRQAARGVRHPRGRGDRERPAVRSSCERASHELAETLSLRHYLLDLSTVLLSTLDQKKVFEQIAETLKTLVDYDTMDVRLVDEQAGELVAIFARDTSAEQMLEFRSPLGVGVTGWVVEHNQAQLVNDMIHDRARRLVPDTPTEPQASIIVPLNVRGKVSGVLTLDRLGGRHFDERELETAQLFANLAAIAIQNARTYNEMERAGHQRRPDRHPQLPPLLSTRSTPQ